MMAARLPGLPAQPVERSLRSHHVTYPANFQLITAMNPCRCGYLNDPARACSGSTMLTAISFENFRSYVDRFDMMIEVPEVPISVLTDPVENENSAQIMKRILQAREMANARKPQGQAGVNADLNPDLVDKLIILDDKASGSEKGV